MDGVRARQSGDGEVGGVVTMMTIGFPFTYESLPPAAAVPEVAMRREFGPVVSTKTSQGFEAWLLTAYMGGTSLLLAGRGVIPW